MVIRPSMRSIRIVAVALLVGSALSACGTVAGSGDIVSRDITVASFSKLEVSSAFVVTVRLGQSEKVTIRADGNVMDAIGVEVSGDTLHVTLKPGASVWAATLEADVVARSLDRIDGSEASRITLGEPLSGEQLDISLSGASSLTGELSTANGTIELSGAASADLVGSVSTLEVTASGASVLSGTGLTIGRLTIDLSGASRAEVTATGSLSAVATGASSLRYGGTPTVERADASGGSQIAPIG